MATRIGDTVYLSASEVAEKTGLAHSTVTRYCRGDDGTENVFPNAVKAGNAWLVPESDLDGYEERLPPVGKWAQADYRSKHQGGGD